MLAARFLVFGVVFIYIARDPVKNVLWITAMIFIQLIDLVLGIYYTATGVVELKDSAFAMFNATWIAGLLYLWRPRAEAEVAP